jgi:hypothetical protein
MDEGLRCVMGPCEFLLLINLSSCSFFVHVCCSLRGLEGRFRKETQDIKRGGRLYLCEETMEWKMEGYIISFWFCLDFLNVMRVVGITLI